MRNALIFLIASTLTLTILTMAGCASVSETQPDTELNLLKKKVERLEGRIIHLEHMIDTEAYEPTIKTQLTGNGGAN